MKKYLIAALTALVILTGCKQPTGPDVQDLIPPKSNLESNTEEKTDETSQQKEVITKITISPVEKVRLGIENPIEWNRIEWNGEKIEFGGDGYVMFYPGDCSNPLTLYFKGNNTISTKSSRFTNKTIVITKKGNAEPTVEYKGNDESIKVITTSNTTSKTIGFIEVSPEVLLKKCNEFSYTTKDFKYWDLANWKGQKINEENKYPNVSSSTPEKVLTIDKSNKALKGWLEENFDKLKDEKTKEDALRDLQEMILYPAGGATSKVCSERTNASSDGLWLKAE